MEDIKEVVNAEARGLVKFTIDGQYEGEETVAGKVIGRNTFKVGYIWVFDTVEEAIAKAQEMVSDHGNGWMAVHKAAATRFKYGEPQWSIGRGEVVHVVQAPTGPQRNAS